MFVTVGIVATIAIAGYFGYKNKETVLWNGVKLYDSIKDYCSQFQDTFKLDNIAVYNGEEYINIDVNKWRNIPIYLIGICDTYPPNDKYSIGISYILNYKKYCRVYSLEHDKNADSMINDIIKLEKHNIIKPNKSNKSNNSNNNCDAPINFILSASYFNGFEEYDVTELLQMFDIDGDFYKNNNELTFDDILKWNNRLKLYSLCEKENELIYKDEDKYIEIVNLFGEFKIFMLSDILNFNNEE